MGNNQSTTDRPNRLSKPKTNTNSPSPAFVTDSLVSVSSRYGDLSVKERQQIRETLLSQVDTKFESAVWSNKDGDAIGELGPQTRGRPLSILSRSNSMSCFGSRHGSTTKLNELHGSKISLGSNTQADLDTDICLLQEVKRNASPEDLTALHEALEPSTNATVLSTEHGLSRRTSLIKRSSLSLTRRRSLVQTPGVATRNSPIEGWRKTWNSWKAPKVAPEEAAKWAVTPKGVTSMNRSLAPGPPEDGRSTPTPRAQTPGELDYAHLGSLKLGTLSIVNGAPSPAPSVKIMKQKSRYGGEVDYFAATEPGSSPLMMETTRRGHFKSKSSVLPMTAPLHDRNWVPGVDSTARPTSKPQDFHSFKTRQAFDAEPEIEPVKSFRVTNENVAALGHDANRLAQDYQADIPNSPFEDANMFNRPVDDEGFLLHDTTSYKEEAVQVLAGTIFDAPTTAIEASGSALFSTASRKSTAEKQIREIQRPAPRTADSGYSSGGSLRVSDRSQQAASPTVSAKPSEYSASVEQAVNSGTSHQSDPQVGSAQLVSTNVAEAKTHRQPLSMQIPDRSERSSTSDSILSPKSPHSVVSKSSFDSTSSVTQRRLQRRRSAHPEPPVVQSCQSIPEGTIPEIPDNVRAKFSRRLSNTPGMECLTHTYESKDHITTNEPVVDNASAAQTEATIQLTELEPERPPTPPPHGRRKSLSLFRRKSTVRSKEVDQEDESGSPGVVDLGTIASSLGSSPYDAAMSRPLRQTVTSPTHPHQLGAKLPRAKSMVGMDSQAAAEFARMHSKDRALAELELPQQRRGSYHNPKMEAGEAKAAKRRPHSSLHDIPPVPAISSTKLKVPQSARLRSGNEGQEQKSDLSFGVRSPTKEHNVAHLVSRPDQNRQSLPQQSVNWDAHSQLWRQRRKSIGEGLGMHASFSQASASTINSRNTPQPRENMVAWGRYSGGLDYNYEGCGAGVGGSAGTRQLHSAASTKSLKWRTQYGVDLSDVPIMLQRA